MAVRLREKGRSLLCGAIFLYVRMLVIFDSLHGGTFRQWLNPKMLVIYMFWGCQGSQLPLLFLRKVVFCHFLDFKLFFQMVPFIVGSNFPLFKMTNERNLEKRKMKICSHGFKVSRMKWSKFRSVKTFVSSETL